MEQGTWPEFVDNRSELISGGMTPVDAHVACIKRFLGDIAAITAGGDNPPEPEVEEVEVEKKKPSRKTKKPTSKIEEDPPEREENEDPGVIGAVPAVPPLVRLEDFKGKAEVGEVENITWVANNLRVVNVSAAECPSLRAWNLLCECRENAYFRKTFWKDHYGKIIPSKAQLEGIKKHGGIDGQPMVELINRIQAISNEAKGMEEDEDGQS